MSDTILVDRQGAIATVIINRPEKRNALNSAAWAALGETMRSLSDDDSLRCVVLRGAGDEAFAAGADISGFEEERSTGERVKIYTANTDRALDAVSGCRHPTIAMIRGFCLGGGVEIACGCDIRIASTSSRFGIPVKRLGIYLHYSYLSLLVETVGRAVALELILEGRVLEAQEALQKGLVTRIVPDDELVAETYAAAERIADGAPLSARHHKRAIRRVAERPPITDAEIEASYAYADTADYHDAYRAFLAKRKPRFQGR